MQASKLEVLMVLVFGVFVACMLYLLVQDGKRHEFKPKDAPGACMSVYCGDWVTVEV